MKKDNMTLYQIKVTTSKNMLLRFDTSHKNLLLFVFHILFLKTY